MANKIETRDFESIKNELQSNPTKMMKDAADNEMNLSQYLNRTCPDVLLGEKRSITNKLMEEFGFVARGASFIKATTYEEFAQTPHGRALAYDYIYRNHFLPPSRRDVPMFPSSNTDALYPDATSVPRVEPDLQPRFDPNTLVGLQTNVSSSTYKVFRWKPTEEDLKRERVEPGSKLPTMQLAEQEAPINLVKWGIAAELTYEAIRRQDLDKVGTMLSLETRVEDRRQLDQFVKVLKDGDERDGVTATDGTVLDTKAVSVSRTGGQAGEIDLKNLMLFMAGWPQGYSCTHILCSSANAVDIALLTNGTQNTPISFLTGVSAPGIPGFTIPGIGGNVTVLITDSSDIGANEFLGIDASASLEKVNEVGSDIREQSRQIDQQTELMTFSDTYGLAKLITNATRVLDVS